MSELLTLPVSPALRAVLAGKLPAGRGELLIPGESRALVEALPGLAGLIPDADEPPAVLLTRSDPGEWDVQTPGIAVDGDAGGARLHLRLERGRGISARFDPAGRRGLALLDAWAGQPRLLWVDFDGRRLRAQVVDAPGLGNFAAATLADIEAALAAALLAYLKPLHYLVVAVGLRDGNWKRIWGTEHDGLQLGVEYRLALDDLRAMVADGCFPAGTAFARITRRDGRRVIDLFPVAREGRRYALPQWGLALGEGLRALDCRRLLRLIEGRLRYANRLASFAGKT